MFTKFATRRISVTILSTSAEIAQYHLFISTIISAAGKNMRSTVGWVRAFTMNITILLWGWPYIPIRNLVSAPRGVASAKFHYRSLAINIIN